MHGTLHITSLDKSLTLRRCDTGMPLSLHITRVNVCVWVDWGKLCVCVFVKVSINMPASVGGVHVLVCATAFPCLCLFVPARISAAISLYTCSLDRKST